MPIMRYYNDSPPVSVTLFYDRMSPQRRSAENINRNIKSVIIVFDKETPVRAINATCETTDRTFRDAQGVIKFP